ncbi:CHASE domain-containing protein [Herbaspirillum sp. NPDC087042]|uniref:CHASE domain-containing protein n=1 Tax=Herbaspirillum sp. NPDC087042 TaxID=3364004 RepID=UPI0037FB2407
MTRVTRNTCLFLLLAFGLLLAGVLGIAYLNDKEVRDGLAQDSRWIRDDITALMLRYELALHGTRGAILAIGPDELSRERFLRYTDSRDASQEFPWANGFGFIRRVAPRQRAAYERKLAQGHMPFSSIQQFNAPASDLYVIEQIEPLESNRKALGIDIASSQDRRSAADNAMLTGRAELTSPIQLVQGESAGATSYLFLLPIYAGSVTPATIEQRQERIIGWAYSPLSVKAILRELSQRWNPRALQIQIEDVTHDGASTELFRSDNFTSVKGNASLDSALPLYGRAWRLHIRSTPQYLQTHQFISDRAVLLSVGTLSLLIVAVALAYQAFARRERKLQQAQALLAAVVDSSPDAIITTDAKGMISSWNKGAADYLQRSREQALGTPLSAHGALRELDARASTTEEKLHAPPAAHVISLHGQLTRYASALLFPLRDRAGAPIGKAFMLRDITHEKNIERELHRINEELESTVQQRTHALHKAKTMLQTVLDVMPSLVGYWDKQLINRFANAAYERVFHRPASEIRGMHMRDLMDRDLYEKSLPHIEAVLTGQKQTFERSFEHPGSGIKHVLTTYIPDVAEDGEVLGFYVVAHDVTEITHNRDQLSGALQQNQFLLDQVQDANLLLNNVLHSATGVAIIATSPQGLITLFNSGAENMLGYSAEETVGHLCEQQFCWPVAGQPQPGDDATSDLLYRRKDGATLRVSRQRTTMLDHRQRHVGYLYIAVDMSLQRQQEAELAAARDQLVLAADVAKLGVWVWDQESDVLHFNRQIAEIYGIDDKQGRYTTSYEDWRHRVHPDDVGYVESSLQAALAGTGEYEPIFRVVRRDGSLRYVQARAHVERNGMGTPVRVIGINLDITQRIEFENNLVDARLKAEQANSAKSLFLASVSHEIRTPMNGVLGMIQLLQRTHPLPGQCDYLDKAEFSAKSLLNLLNDLLDFSKMDVEQLQLDLQAFSLAHFTRDLSAILAGTPPQAGVLLNIELDPRLPQRVVGDAYRLQQILVNLVGNALKFTHQGRIDVRFSHLAPVKASTLQLRVEVIDTGIGIAAERLADIFDAFTQAEASITRRYGGTGLGLAISKHLVGLMGAQLQVSSEPGRGSRFWFDLALPVDDETPVQLACPDAPSPASAKEGPPPEQSHPLAAVRILLVEDNAVNRQVASELLALSGAEVSCAENGSTGVAMACDPARQFDLILMDLQMPDIDGIEASRRIRRHHELRGIPILAMTANASPQDKRRCIDAGMAGHIAKPIDVSTLIPMLLSHLHPERAAQGAVVTPPASPATEAPGNRQSVDSYATIMRRYSQAGDIYRTTLNASAAELERLYAQYREALAQHALPQLAQASHAIKGMAATIGARGLAAYFGAIEQRSRFGSAEQAEALIALCRQEVDESQRDCVLVLQQLEVQALHSGQISPPASSGRPAPTSDFPDRQRLRALLSSSNLEAIDLADVIGRRHDLMQQPHYLQVIELIEKLDFPAALALLDRHFGEAP